MASAHDAPARLLSANTQWARDVENNDSTFFKRSAKGQAPPVLWIGCADSRVPESTITGARPGDIFVHRNIANQFPVGDVNAEAVLAYAVHHLHVQHVVVVGHTECGGAAACLAAVQRPTFPEKGPVLTISSLPYEDPLNQWLEPLTTLTGSLQLSTTSTEVALPIVVEENVKLQVENLSKTATIRDAWASQDAKERNVYVHGWVYNLSTGLLKDLNVTRGPSSFTQNPQLKTDKVYQIINTKSDTALDVKGHNIVGWKQHTQNSQRWKLKKEGNHWALHNISVNKYLGIAQGALADGLPIFARDNNPITYWDIKDTAKPGEFRVSVPKENFDLDLSNNGDSKDGTYVILWTHRGDGTNQVWRFVEVA